MGGLDPTLPRPPAPHAVEPLPPHAMQHIRKVFDEDGAGKKSCSFISPREDARMYRNAESHAVPCECIVELYELLWRWGHRNTAQGGFAQNFGFAIPDTIVIVKGKPYAWYFISQKDGRLLRKTDVNSSLNHFEKKFCSGSKVENESQLCATWMPIASQFPEARCHIPHAEFLSVGACRGFLGSLRSTHSGVLQAFVEPHGVYNFLVRTVTFHSQTSLCVRTNRSLMARHEGTWFYRAATFEGWDGLSSTSSRYRSHKHPHMEELILAVGETLNLQIEQERVRQMLFLGPNEHVALHFKVTKDHMLYFIYASVVSEKEVILQTRPQLLMGDQCMTESLPGAALLAGGTDRKAYPYEGKPFWERAYEPCELTLPATERASSTGGLPPIMMSRSEIYREDGVHLNYNVPDSGRTQKIRRRPLSERRAKDSILPKMMYMKPDVPEAPFRVHHTPHSLQESGRYEYMPPFLGLDTVKRPLVTHATSRSEPPLTVRNPDDIDQDAPNEQVE